MILDWYTITIQALQDLWVGFLVFIPKLTGALIILLIGWFVSTGLGQLITEVLKRAQFNKVFESKTWKTALEKAELKVDPAGFIGAIFKWVLMIVFLMAGVEILGMVQFADFLTNVLNYLPNVIVAALILVVAVIIADIVEKVVRTGVESTKAGYGHLVGIIIRWSIWVFAILAILDQLQIAPGLLQTLFAGFVAMIAIGGGIAFGLGGKDVAGEILQNMKRKLQG